jgi:hypothetical protein
MAGKNQGKVLRERGSVPKGTIRRGMQGVCEEGKGKRKTTQNEIACC